MMLYDTCMLIYHFFATEIYDVVWHVYADLLFFATEIYDVVWHMYVDLSFFDTEIYDTAWHMSCMLIYLFSPSKYFVYER